MLLRQDWVAARMNEVVTGVVSLVAEPARFDVDGPIIEMAPSAALSLSLLLHELGTNAVKHDSLSGETARVRIAWRVDTKGGAPTLCLSCDEEGGPAAVEPTRKGFGFRLIGMGLAGEASDVVQRFGQEGIRPAPGRPSRPSDQQG